ncbi:MAG TPA: hypothetical protein PKD77_12140 [Rudaea sp.]|nr:hypothetical protein [Rudaea sp.]
MTRSLPQSRRKLKARDAHALRDMRADLLARIDAARRSVCELRIARNAGLSREGALYTAKLDLRAALRLTGELATRCNEATTFDKWPNDAA